MNLSLRSEYQLSEAEFQFYHREGYLIIRELFPPMEIGFLAIECGRLAGLKALKQSNNIRCRWQDHFQTGECLFETFDPVIDLSPICEQVARDPRLIGVISQLYGEQAHSFKDKLIFKPPGAKGHTLHQDSIRWPNFPRSFVTAAVAIDPCNQRKGATEVFARVHQRGYLSPEYGEYRACPPDSVDESAGIFLELEPGDVAIYGCFVPHRSAPNKSDHWLRLLYLSYNADSGGGDRRQSQNEEFHTWLKKKYAEYGRHETYFE